MNIVTLAGLGYDRVSSQTESSNQIVELAVLDDISKCTILLHSLPPAVPRDFPTISG